MDQIGRVQLAATRNESFLLTTLAIEEVQHYQRVFRVNPNRITLSLTDILLSDSPKSTRQSKVR
jgi:hypothetical protein